MEAIEDRERAHQSQCSQRHATHGDSRDDVDGVVRLLGEEVTAGYVECAVHDAILFQQLINALQVVERVVNEELQFGDDAQLMAQATTQLITDSTHIGS